ncbi:class I SAM-dependent methyltransferase [Kineobactrum sediminis]|uniref:Class I SAM-dependent methyltransferase n=1 Tax=Kineobactrum sediminis TaxID=1905677 RepID=A0A2N5Y5Q2_9GAMM|nr:class I SAM-dependent methyltransferase [Kineobactrum sediminis]PLW83726.1 class I SAM-dependent methyltransferase [Kineobactrum sediminis]
MSNEEQIAYWNGEAGRKWAAKDAMMATMLAPIARDLLAHAKVQDCSRALDVGCGGGSETLMLAEHLGPGSTVLGVDISTPMLEVARQRAAADPATGHQVEFLQADAATHSFGERNFDLLFSRFGVMFFDDPAAAFSNMRTALAPGAKLAFCCWQRLPDNPWALIPLQAALEHVAPPEPPAPNAPGPFAFADPLRVRTVLEQAGLKEIAIAPHAVNMCWSNNGNLDATVRDMLNMGPVSRLLQDESDTVRQAVYHGATQAMTPWFIDGEMRLPGAVWFITATH